MRVASFKAEEDLLELLEKYARKRKLSKSEIIRRAIRNYLHYHGERPYITRRIRVY